ncbi:hypothetical protein QUF54_07975, partial [Candidatus Marithioploca araucensis]|nr:hypothetical protein [Candidatus Marithioploca araucensis]
MEFNAFALDSLLEFNALALFGSFFPSNALALEVFLKSKALVLEVISLQRFSFESCFDFWIGASFSSLFF